MATQMFVNLPVKNLDASVAFFTKLGFSFNPQFTDDKATCMLVGSDCFVMLLVESFFKEALKNRDIADTTKSAEALVALSAESKEKVDEMVNNAIAAGARTHSEAVDHGFMYQRSFQDLDGHQWEIFWMDPSTIA